MRDRERQRGNETKRGLHEERLKLRPRFGQFRNPSLFFVRCAYWLITYLFIDMPLQSPLNDEENEIMRQQPNSIYLSNNTIIERKRVAQKLCRWYLEVDNTLDNRTKAIYEQYPMWAFYEDKESKVGIQWLYHITLRVSKLPKRVFGVMVMSDGSVNLHTVSCMMMFPNVTLGGRFCFIMSIQTFMSKQELPHPIYNGWKTGP